MNQHARVTVTLTEAVAATKNARSDFQPDVHNHIPGSVLRGAVAAIWIRQLGPEITTTPEFARIFDGEGTFGPLHTLGSQPIPLSVQVHKYEPERTCQKLWWDAALGEIAEDCPDCRYPLEFSKGQSRGSVDFTTRIMTALSTDGVAKDGHLFRQKALRQDQRMHGWLYGEAVAALKLNDTPITSVLLGSRRSLRGSATVELEHDAVPEPVECIGNDIILRLASPGVFVDDFGLPSQVPNLIELTHVLGVKAINVDQHWTRWDEVGGWHAASGLPKPAERAVAAGSTYRVRCAEQPSETALRALMARGVGLRRREGFGALFRPEAPRAVRSWTGSVAPLRQRPQLLPAFRNRLDGLRRGTTDDAVFRRALENMRNAPDTYVQAFRTMLDITDADLYEKLLDFLEQG
ncbi:CRISPR-associated protein Csx10 [Saccharopolyspora kobensis]|uniref:CRISPR-associated protein Csx10 n=1 Tax=Saccharopolyspora kobensis TaxID=146035 RepID=A0A1H5VRM0_9PSEU|nr:type III-B CRISPR module-associated Cmr3 family protein [Saccharopolyspora kobensis]SEF89783.1 CRISPR-associated protein Csx10 [Saccharopolyspora kobensis]SFC57933.1 CRISPR-associated protein Csx10 [Saccharopolyspora kobensis]